MLHKRSLSVEFTLQLKSTNNRTISRNISYVFGSKTILDILFIVLFFQNYFFWYVAHAYAHYDTQARTDIEHKYNVISIRNATIKISLKSHAQQTTCVLYLNLHLQRYTHTHTHECRQVLIIKDKYKSINQSVSI